MTNPPPNPGRFDGIVCVVTGAARGIGHAIAERLGAEGGRVACVDVSEKRLVPAASELEARGLDVRPYAVDVGDRGAVQRAFAAIEADFASPVGVLVNNAVWARFQPLADIDEASVDRMLAIGLKALLWTTQAAAPQMRRRGRGAIVNVGSVASRYTHVDSMVYAALKGGVVGLTRAAAVELAKDGIRVNAVLPGMVGTEASKAQFDAATLAAREGHVPLGRFGEAGEIAAAVAFLASADAAYVQGAELVVDGGWTRAAT